MALPEFVIMSQPHEVRFAGFTSTTTQLQQAGWRLAAEQDIYRDSLRLLARHDNAGLYLVADQVGLNYFQFAQRPERLVFHVSYVARALECLRVDFPFDAFKSIDAMPQVVPMNRQRIEDFEIFATPLVRTEEIIVEPQSVAECLELIRKMQAPELAQIRKRNQYREGERAPAVNQTNFHAQIISLAA